MLNKKYFTVEFNNNGDSFKSSMEFNTEKLAEYYYNDTKSRFDNVELKEWEIRSKILNSTSETVAGEQLDF